MHMCSTFRHQKGQDLRKLPAPPLSPAPSSMSSLRWAARFTFIALLSIACFQDRWQLEVGQSTSWTQPHRRPGCAIVCRHWSIAFVEKQRGLRPHCVLSTCRSYINAAVPLGRLCRGDRARLNNLLSEPVTRCVRNARGNAMP